MAIWITSDFHFNHQKEFVYQARGFSSIEEMNKAIITNYNSVVQPEDDVYILGDCLLGGADRLDVGIELMTWLNGRIHLIRGNHDSDKKWEAYKQLSNVVEQENAVFLKYKKYHFYLSHFPTICANYDNDKPLKQKLINLCGHSHTKNPFADIDKGLIYHCEVDSHGCMPVLLDNIIEDLKEYFSNDIND